MNFLLDMPISPKVGIFLKTLGHHAEHLFDLGKKKAFDEEIVVMARHKGSVIISLDLDFGTILSYSQETSPGVILFRMRYPTVENICKKLELLLKNFDETQLFHSVVIVQDNRIRVRHLPIEKNK